MTEKTESKIDDGVYSVEFEQGFRYITERGDWIILSKHTNDEPGARFMHLTLLDKDTYEHAETYSKEQQTLDDLADRAAKQEFERKIDNNNKPWENDLDV